MNAPNKSGWKPEMTAAEDGLHTGPATTTGNRALMLEEPLLFEIGHAETTGVDLPEPDLEAGTRLGGLERSERREELAADGGRDQRIRPQLAPR